MSSPTPLYLDNAATSFPKPRVVREAMLDYFDTIGASAGRGSYREADAAGELLWRCRETLAALINAPSPERLVFTLNCTDALNLAIKGLLRDGDHVVTTWMDHNSVLRPLHALEESGRITVTRVRADEQGLVDAAAVGEAIGDGTRLVAMVHASNVSGSLQPAAEVGRICRERGAYFLLDAAQTIGSIPLDVGELGVDLLAFPGHKALLGPPGTGGLWISSRVDLAPLREGGTGSRSEEAVQPLTLPDRYEPGSHNLLGLAGLLGALEYLRGEGIEAIAEHKRKLSAAFVSGLTEIVGVKLLGPRRLDDRVAVFSVTIEGVDPSSAGVALDRDYGIKVRAGLHCAPLAHQSLGTLETGSVRFSPGYLTRLEDVERTLEAVQRYARWVSSSGPGYMPR
jgi:cysteine desulfurase family protein